MPDEQDELHQQLMEAAQALINGLERDIEMEEVLDREIEEDVQKLETVKGQVKEIIQDQKNEMAQLRDIHQRIQEFHQMLQQMGDASSDEEMYIANEELEELKEIISDVRTLEDLVSEEESDVEVEVEEAIRTVVELAGTFQTMQIVKQQLRQARNIEEGIQTIAQKQGYQDVMNALRTADGDEQTAEQLYQQIQSDEQQLNAEIEDIRSAIVQEAELNKKEVKEIKEDVTGDQKLFKEVKTYLEPLAQKQKQKLGANGTEKVKTDQAKKAQNLIDEINEMESELQSIDKHLERLLKMKKIEEEEEEETVNKLDSIWDDMTG